MENFLWKEILSQPENLQAVIEHLFGAERRRLHEAASFLNNGKPILLTGMGSAEYLCYPAEHHLVHNGRIANTMSAAEVYYDYLSAIKNFNILINSRSGETIEVVKLCQYLSANNIPYVALTNNPSSTLARLAEHVVFTNSRKDTLVSINIVTGMMVATLVLAFDILGELEKSRDEFDRLPGLLNETIQLASNQAEKFAAQFENFVPIYLLFRGPSKGSAACSRLVLEEVARRPAVDMDASAFRQGPIEVGDGKFGALIFLTYGETGSLNQSLTSEIRSYGGTVLTIGGKPAVINSLMDQLHVDISQVLPGLSPVIEVVPAQILAYKLAEKQGYVPGEVRYISRVITSEGIA